MSLASITTEEVSPIDPFFIAVLSVVVVTALVFASLYAVSESKRTRSALSARREAAAHRISGAITRPSDTGDVLQGLFQQAAEELRADVVLVGLLDEETQDIVGFAAWGTDERWKEFRMPLGHPTSGAASSVRSREVIAVEEVAGSRFRDGPIVAKMRLVSCAFAPMVEDDCVVGVLVFGFRSARRFGAADIGLIDTLAAEAAVGIGRGQYLEGLKELHREKDEFISMVSHELRNPLTAIKGYGEMMRRPSAGPLSDTQAEYLDVVMRSADRMFALIEDLMTVSRAEGGLLSIEKRPIDFTEVMSAVVTSVQPKARQKNLKVLCLPSGSQVISADRKRTEQVLMNLVDNAIKFSPIGGTVRLESQLRDGGLWVEVSDEGVGIPVDEQDRLFQKFFRASTAEHGDTPGTGLGLAICKAIVELHGGYIGGDSHPGAGSRFHFWIPGTS